MNFKQMAVEFVRANNCACHTPVELIEKAMKDGAAEATREAALMVKAARLELAVARSRNFKG